MNWIKVEVATLDKPEVLAITAAMGWTDPDLTMGKLFRLWAWFDKHSVDGRIPISGDAASVIPRNAASVTFALLDSRVVGAPGFCEAVAAAGWLLVTDAGVSLPNFGRHNGNTAKSRANAASRAFSFRARKQSGEAEKDAASVTLASRSERYESVTGVTSDTNSSCSSSLSKNEEKNNTATTRARTKRRESVTIDSASLIAEGIPAEVADDFLAHRKRKRAPLTRIAWEGIKSEAGKTDLSLEDVLRKMLARGWTGFESDWVSKPGSMSVSSSPALSKQEALEKRNHAVARAVLADFHKEAA